MPPLDLMVSDEAAHYMKMLPTQLRSTMAAHSYRVVHVRGVIGDFYRFVDLLKVKGHLARSEDPAEAERVMAALANTTKQEASRRATTARSVMNVTKTREREARSKHRADQAPAQTPEPSPQPGVEQPPAYPGTEIEELMKLTKPALVELATLAGVPHPRNIYRRRPLAEAIVAFRAKTQYVKQGTVVELRKPKTAAAVGRKGINGAASGAGKGRVVQALFSDAR